MSTSPTTQTLIPSSRTRLRPPVTASKARESTTAPRVSTLPPPRIPESGTRRQTTTRAAVTSSAGTARMSGRLPANIVPSWPESSAPPIAPACSATTITPVARRVTAAESGSSRARE